MSTESTTVHDPAALQAELYAMLVKTNHAVNRCETQEELYREACRIVVDTGHFRFAWVGVPYVGSVKVAAQAGEDSGYLEKVMSSGVRIALDRNDPLGQGPTGRALSTGVRAVVNDFATAGQTAPWHELAAHAGFHASAAFPLREHGKVVAALTVYAGTPNFFTPALVDTLGEVTPALSLALDRFALEQQRAEQEASFRLRERALEAVGHSLTITDARAHDQPIIYASEGFEALTGYSASDVFGCNCRILQGEGTDPQAVRQVSEAIKAGRRCTVELLNYRRDGQPFWNRLTIAPIRDETGRITHFAGSQTLIPEPGGEPGLT